MLYETINTEEELDKVLKENMGVLLYFSTFKCNVGEALEPKVIKMLNENFPKIPFYYIDMQMLPEVAAKHGVFVEPTILVFFDGRETIRKSRLISIPDLAASIERIYKLAFD